MKTREQVEKEIHVLNDQLDALYQRRHDVMNDQGGLTEEQNQDFHHDVSYIECCIKTLTWVLKEDGNNLIKTI